jgi:hypothetical protein
MALHDHHARHEDHDTGLGGPQEHHSLDKVVFGCPPRCSIALETGGSSDELSEGAQ